MWEVTKFPLTCLLFYLELIRPLYCLREIPECNSYVKLQFEFYDVMPAKSYEMSAHLLRFFYEATSRIIFERHSRMEFRRKGTMRSH